jgi:thioredoxin-related protein
MGMGAGVLLALFLSAHTLAAGFHDLSLDRLDTKESLALADYHGAVVLLTFFEPECAWCNRQLKTLEHLGERCGDDLQSIAVGINGRADALRKELRRARVTFPGAEASAALLEQVGEVPATPWTLVLTPDGEIAATLRGFVSAKPLAAAFPDLCPSDIYAE